VPRWYYFEVKTLTALIAACALAMVTGCAGSRHAALTPIAASEPDPWAGYKDGRVQDESAPKPESKDSAEAATPAPAPAKPTAAASDELPDDTAPVPAKKASKKKSKKARSGAVAGKKPRKRAKRAS